MDKILLLADDDSDVRDAGVANRLDHVEENGLVRDGDELLRARVRDGAKPRSA